VNVLGVAPIANVGQVNCRIHQPLKFTITITSLILWRILLEMLRKWKTIGISRYNHISECSLRFSRGPRANQSSHCFWTPFFPWIFQRTWYAFFSAINRGTYWARNLVSQTSCRKNFFLSDLSNIGDPKPSHAFLRIWSANALQPNMSPRCSFGSTAFDVLLPRYHLLVSVTGLRRDCRTAVWLLEGGYPLLEVKVVWGPELHWRS